MEAKEPGQKPSPFFSSLSETIRRSMAECFNGEAEDESSAAPVYFFEILDLLEKFNNSAQKLIESGDKDSVLCQLSSIVERFNVSFPFQENGTTTRKASFILTSLLSNNDFELDSQCLNVLSKLALTVPSFLDPDLAKAGLPSLSLCLRSSSPKVQKATLIYVGNLAGSSRENSLVLSELIPPILAFTPSDETRDSFFFALRAFTHSASRDGLINLRVALPTIVKAFNEELKRQSDADALRSTVYAAWALSDIVEANYPGTADELARLQIFTSIPALLLLSDPLVVKPALRVLAFLFMNLPSKNFEADLPFDRLMRLLSSGVCEESQEAAAAIAAVLDGDPDLAEEFWSRNLVDKLLDLLQVANFVQYGHFCTCLKEAIRASTPEMIQTVHLSRLVSTIMGIVEKESPSLNVILLSALMDMLQKAQSTEFGATILKVLRAYDVETVIGTCCQSDDEELVRTADAFSSLLHQIERM